jgi:hypothetical protein
MNSECVRLRMTKITKTGARHHFSRSRFAEDNELAQAKSGCLYPPKRGQATLSRAQRVDRAACTRFPTRVTARPCDGLLSRAAAARHHFSPSEVIEGRGVAPAKSGCLYPPKRGQATLSRAQRVDRAACTRFPTRVTTHACDGLLSRAAAGCW